MTTKGCLNPRSGPDRHLGQAEQRIRGPLQHARHRRGRCRGRSTISPISSSISWTSEVDRSLARRHRDPVRVRGKSRHLPRTPRSPCRSEEPRLRSGTRRRQDRGRQYPFTDGYGMPNRRRRSGRGVCLHNKALDPKVNTANLQGIRAHRGDRPTTCSPRSQLIHQTKSHDRREGTSAESWRRMSRLTT